ncbi:hypothetical protein NPIL_305241 [Nephila pilipes]|uniref:Uncharacterized protein n=1 Tax=Nephila pilipes TaxID=299642 RepID=A0A8X6TEW3_NEPPI|nr:hypothetical protein NPIL_305241 [Nephila pilipes]
MLLEQKGMKLYKWVSSDSVLLCNNAEANQNYSFTTKKETKAVGILWKHQSNEFSFKVIAEQKEAAKHAVLSTIPKISDLLSYISPTITRIKLFMQRMWLLKLVGTIHFRRKYLENNKNSCLPRNQ